MRSISSRVKAGSRKSKLILNGEHSERLVDSLYLAVTSQLKQNEGVNKIIEDGKK